MSDNLPILICFGTRPEWLKIKPILSELSRDQYKLLFTGQHKDLLYDIPVDYTITINQSNCRLDQLIVDTLAQFPNVPVRGVLIQGDTASTFSCALAAYHRKLPIFYLEAGLRSYDLDHPYPEEGYRQMISRIANVNFAPTKLAFDNLKNENVQGQIYIVGNTVLDNLKEYGNASYGDEILVTLHRRENYGMMKEWFSTIEMLANVYTKYTFVLPMHPSPDIQKYRHVLKKVQIVPSLKHSDLIDILKNSRLVITDSGGLQEEGSFFNKKIIVCRKITERPEGITTGHLHLCPEPAKLAEIFQQLITNPFINSVCPYGDGFSGKRVAELLS